MKYHKVSDKIWSAILKYLTTRPYIEVAQALEEIGMAKIEIIEDEPIAAQSEK